MSSERTVVLVVALALAGCADLGRGDPRPDGAPADTGPHLDGGATSDTASAPISFAADVHRLLLDGCVRCHAPGGAAGATAFVLADDVNKDRAQALAFVNQASPAGSRLLAKTAGAGHGGGAIYATGTPEYQTVLQWIMQGSAP